MKTKGKELVEISDICDEVYTVAVNINICWNNTIQTLLRLKY